MIEGRSICMAIACCVLLANCAAFKPKEARPALGEKEWVSYDGKVTAEKIRQLVGE